MGTQLVAAPRFQGRTVSASLPVRPRPIGGGWQVWQTADGRSAIVDEGVVDVIRAVEREQAPRETGGILFGRGFRDWAGDYVLVTHVERPRPGEVVGTVSTVAITAEGAAAMGQRALKAQPVADVVGWYHTHPSYAAYFSDVDRAEQRRWPSSLAVGLVMSGRDDAEPRYSVFIGPDSTPTSSASPGLAPAPVEERTARDAGAAVIPYTVDAPARDRGSDGRLPHGARRRRLVFGLALIALALVQLTVIVWQALPSGPSQPSPPESSSRGGGEQVQQPLAGPARPLGPTIILPQAWVAP